MADKIIQSIKFDERGLIPAIIQDAANHEALLLGLMDNNSLLRTLQTGQAHFVLTGDAPISIPSHQLVAVPLNAGGASLTVFIEYEPNYHEPLRPTSLLKD